MAILVTLANASITIDTNSSNTVNFEKFGK